MEDDELLARVAEIEGLEWIGKKGDGGPYARCVENCASSVWWKYTAMFMAVDPGKLPFNPLQNDAQAMELVKEHGVNISAPRYYVTWRGRGIGHEETHISWEAWVGWHDKAEDESLNRAILKAIVAAKED